MRIMTIQDRLDPDALESSNVGFANFWTVLLKGRYASWPCALVMGATCWGSLTPTLESMTPLGVSLN